VRNLISGFGAHPAPVVFTLSRGGDGEPQEAVLPMRGKQAEVGPALRGMGSGKWTVRLVPIQLVATESGLGAPAVVCQFANPATSCEAPVSGAGLYKLEVHAGDSEARTVLVLVAANADFRSMNETFLEARRVADSWGSGTHPDARHYFLSASLAELNRNAGKAR
jgi:hypothetical protein